MADIVKTGKKPGKTPIRVQLFLKNLANGMTQIDSYLLAGFKAKNKESAAAAASRLLRYLHETMPSREMLNLMVPDQEIFSVLKDKILTGNDDTQVRALAVAGRWKGLEQPDQSGAQGATIIIMQQDRESNQSTIDVTPEKDKPIVRTKLTE